MTKPIRNALAAAFALFVGSALAEPVTYNVDPTHTYPSFEADHMGFFLARKDEQKFRNDQSRQGGWHRQR